MIGLMVTLYCAEICTLLTSIQAHVIAHDFSYQYGHTNQIFLNLYKYKTYINIENARGY